MKYKQVPVETKKISQARGEFNAIVNEVYKEGKRVVIEKSGIPVAGIVSTRDLERLKKLDADLIERADILEKTRAAFRDIDPDELQREIDKAAAEVKAEMKAERLRREEEQRLATLTTAKAS